MPCDALLTIPLPALERTATWNHESKPWIWGDSCPEVPSGVSSNFYDVNDTARISISPFFSVFSFFLHRLFFDLLLFTPVYFCAAHKSILRHNKCLYNRGAFRLPAAISVHSIFQFNSYAVAPNNRQLQALLQYVLILRRKSSIHKIERSIFQFRPYLKKFPGLLKRYSSRSRLQPSSPFIRNSGKR